MSSSIMRDYDETTAFLGQWGPFQQIIFFLLCASTVPNGLNVLSVIFIGDMPPHHCSIPEGNLSEGWRNASIPTELVNGQVEQSRCSRYRLDVIRNLSALGYNPQNTNLTDIQQEHCVDGWTYSKDIYQSTIVTEFDLVCNNQWKQPLTSSIYFLGVMCGSFLSGQLSDRFGRKPVMFVTMMVQTVFTFVRVFSPSWEVFSTLFFIVGLGQTSNYVAVFVLGTEILTGPVRVLYSSLGACLFFAIGYMTLPLIAFFIRDWRMLLVALTVPGLIYIPLWWLIPESPRWLLSQGRVQEAEVILRDAARRNKVTAPEVIFKVTALEVIFKEPEGGDRNSKPEKKHTIVDLMRTSSVRCTTLILFLMWIIFSTGYYSLSLNTSRLSGDPYINSFISAAIEVPAYITSWLALRHLPRRLSSCASMLLGGGVLYFIQVVPPSLHPLSIVLEMTGKFGMTTGIALMFAYTGELYPTVLRNTAVGSCAMVSRVGSVIAPYFTHLSTYHKDLPYILLGTVCVLSSAATFFLPESFNRPLPETIQQMHKRERLKCPPCISIEEEADSREQSDTTGKVIQEIWL